MFMSYTKYEYNDRIEYMGNGQTVPKGATHVRFHPSLLEVCNNAFNGCKSLREVVLNDGLREIGQYAFRDCIALQSINIPSTVTKIGYTAFHNCTSLVEVLLNDGLTVIGDSAFGGCSALESITIPSTVLEISTAAFSGCIGLRELALSDGLKKISQSAFQCCSSLQSVNIPSTVDEIEHFAFRDCTNLRDIVLNYGMKRIKTGTFRGCTSLEHITIPSTVIEIGSTVTEFGDGVFWGCSSLREVVIYNEKIQIGGKSFDRCTSLERFKFPGLWTRLNNVIQAGHRGIEAKIDDIPAVEWRDGELVIPAVHREMEIRLWRRLNDVVEVDKEKMNKIKGLISYYELKEATTLFELALWKARIDQANDEINREACRIEVPGPVKDTILQLLGYPSIPTPRYEGWCLPRSNN